MQTHNQTQTQAQECRIQITHTPRTHTHRQTRAGTAFGAWFFVVLPRLLARMFASHSVNGQYARIGFIHFDLV